MSEEATEVRKQLTVYADAITAFGTAQLVGYVFLMAHGDCFTKNVVSGVRYAVCIGALVNVAYLILVFLCHQGIDKIPEQSIALCAPLRSVRILRYAIITTDLLVTILLPIAISYGWRHAQFFIDCKA